METTLNLHLPGDFTVACELFHVEEAELLQGLLDHLSVHGVFSDAEGEAPEAMAAAFFQRFVLRLTESRPMPPIPAERKALHYRHLQRVLALARSGTASNEEGCRQAVEEWHSELNL